MQSVVRCALTLVCNSLVLLAGCSTVKVDTFPIKEGKIVEYALDSLEDQKRMEIVKTAMMTLGAPYQWGGTDIEKGFDCSGLVFYAYTQNGIDEEEMPRATADLVRNSKPIKRDEIKPGDLVFFNTLGRRYSHVGLYVGRGRFINAPSKGKKVRIDSMDSPYYSQRFNGARRLHNLIREVDVAARSSRNG